MKILYLRRALFLLIFFCKEKIIYLCFAVEIQTETFLLVQ